MYWNYELRKDEETKMYNIHEVYYDDDDTNEVTGVSEPIRISGETKKEVVEQLEKILKDVKK